MSVAINKPVYREPVAEYRFSESKTATRACGEQRHRPHVRRAGASLFVTGLTVLGGLAGTSTGGDYGSLRSLMGAGRTVRGELAPFAELKSVGVSSRLVDTDKPRSDREEIAWIKEHSGLTWDQLGRVFGVSRRAVHMWANGGRLNELNARHLREFSATVRKLEATTPEPTPEMIRAQLLQVESDGYSIVDRLRRERSGGPSWGAPFRPENLVDAIREPLRTRVGEVGQ